jgi:thiol-disulfide isomerase/thioredoxin
MDTTSLPPDDRPPVASPRRPNRGLLWAAALAVVVLSIATIVAFTSGADDGVQKLGGSEDQPIDGSLSGTDVTGAQLPSITFTSFEGGQTKLTVGDAPLVVNFWASTCVPCVTEMPDLERFHQANPDVALLGLQTMENADSGRDMVATTGITYPVGRDPKGAIFSELGGVGLPRTVVVAPNGRITWVHNGPVTVDQLETAVGAARNG